jgi:ATP-dependent Lon protease
MMKKASTFKKLSADQLKWYCDAEALGIQSTDDLKPCPDIIGQRRAINALRLGFDIESHGYNLFVNGLAGTGRRTAIKCLLEETRRIKRIPDDKLYVNNFKNPDMPRLIRLPAGKGQTFKKEMEELIEFFINNIPGLFEDEEYQNKKKRLLESYKQKQKNLVKAFEDEVVKQNFTLIQMQVGLVTRPAVLPTMDKQPINFEQLAALVNEGKISAKERERIEKKHAELTEKLDVVFKEMRDLEKEMKEKVKNLNNNTVTPLIEQQIEEIKQQFKCKAVDEYMEEIKENVQENFDIFLKKPERPEGQLPMMTPQDEGDPYTEFKVNLLVDNCGAKGAPVIFETSPSYANLFGTVEITPTKPGYSQTDFTKIKAGSILKADGGFLVVEALDLLLEPGVWPAFKRTLKNRKLEIQIYAPVYMISISAMKPEPIECDVKVAIIGDPYLYQLLYQQDPDFKKIFKLRADFDSVMDINEDSIRDYANFVKRIVNSEELSAFNGAAIARVVEYGVRLAGKQNKISTQFNHVADILREANYWCMKEGKKRVTDKHIQKAIDEKIDRSRLIEEKIQEMINEGSIMIDTRDEVVGQVNGLAVYDMGDYAFGKPSRITAVASVGNSGVINIEREAQMSGRIHDKGVLILSGYLRSKYAQDKPLAMSASLCFEQSYSGVDGDSASSTEIYALLSVLSGLPLRQDTAVTGSVNQRGEIQPIGGVNQKIEGFFEVCRHQGLTGKQGVMIPHQNVKELMLREEIVKAVKQKKFHIYPVETIDQGIEILTGMKAGKRNKSGYEDGTINNLVDQKLAEYANIGKEYQLKG